MEGGAGFRFDPSQIPRGQTDVGPSPPWEFDADEESLTVEWEGMPGAHASQLDWREVGTDEWNTASDKLKGLVVRKKKLSADKEYEFRVRSSTGAPATWGSWSAPSDPMRIVPPGQAKMAAPTMFGCDNESVTVQWVASPAAEVYELQWRPEAPGTRWISASKKLSSTATRKKNLASGEGYLFRVAPCAGGAWGRFSSPSAPLRPGVSAELVRLVGDSLVAAGGASVPTASVLPGKVVALYFSAHWCPPCRGFTPQLAQFYKAMKAAGKPFEVVFISSDQDQGQFQGYLNEMPWNAVPYNSPLRDAASRTYQVQGIPKLIVLGPRGQILAADGRQAGLSAANVDAWARQAGL